MNEKDNLSELVQIMQDNSQGNGDPKPKKDPTVRLQDGTVVRLGEERYNTKDIKNTR